MGAITTLNLALSYVIFDNHLNSIRLGMTQTIVTAKRWMSVGEIAEYLGVASITIYRWLEKGQIPAHRIGKQWRFNQTAVDAWVESGNAAEKNT